MQVVGICCDDNICIYRDYYIENNLLKGFVIEINDDSLVMIFFQCHEDPINSVSFSFPINDLYF